MEVVGYGDRLSVAAGERIGFMVSCLADGYDATVVRLIHGDTHPDGPGVKEVPVPALAPGRRAGRVQQIRLGSHVRVAHDEALTPGEGLVIDCWVYPTVVGGGIQGILTKWSEVEQRGYGLFLDESGRPVLQLAREHGQPVRLAGPEPLVAFEWCHLRAGWSAPAERSPGSAWIEQTPKRRHAVQPPGGRCETAFDAAVHHTDADLVMGGFHGPGDVAGHYNGKLAAPSLADGSDRQVASWDLAREMSTDRIVDAAGGHHGRAVNRPTRAVTDHTWTGRETCWRVAPEQYNAIFFHDDDLDDAAWEEDFALSLPVDLPSGVYAVRLATRDDEDYVPFFVRPRRGTRTSDVCLLIPTFSYLAYANEQATQEHTQTTVERAALQRQDEYAKRAGLKSLYDVHRDATGYMYSTRLRPILNMRPKYSLALIGGAHQFNADLHLVDWLNQVDCPVDVITDEDLHAEGHDLIAGYRVLLTGTHPEYVSWEILDALEDYTQHGGRIMYLGANGFYWVTSVDPERAHVVEVRRGGRGGTWRSEPGEHHHSTTGELGGLWRERGRAPQRLVGIGSAAMGFSRALPFGQEPGGRAESAGFIFEGVDASQPIGDRGLVLNGAGGHELDRADERLGTPAHALVVAAASGFPDTYQPFTEEVMIIDGHQGGSTNPNVRGDVVLFETENGGAVFAAGSMCWCACLSANDYDNPVARITQNVLRRFTDPAPFQPMATTMESERR